MADEVVNPYAPPAGDVVGAPDKEHLWCVVDGYLAVRHDAFLPPVDLEGDGSGGLLTPVVHHHVPKTRRKKGSPAVIKFRGYTSVASFEARAKRRKILSFLLLASWLLIVFGVITVRYGDRIARDDFRADIGIDIIYKGLAAIGTGFLMIVAGAVWRRFSARVRCCGMRDGWFYLRGVSPGSLSLFSMRSQETPVMVKRKAYRFFGHRLPLSFLIRKHRFNPFAILVFAIMKARRSPGMESIHLHHSEDVRRSPLDGDPALLEQWKRETAGTVMEDWRAIAAKTVHRPGGAMGIESLLFLSPDGKCSAVLMIHRFSNGRSTAVARQSVIRSWTEDRCLQTTTPSSLAIHSAWVDRLQAKGKLPRLLERHLAFVGERPLISIRSDEQLFELLAKEADEEYSTFEAAGFQSPVEVMELPEYSVASKSSPAEASSRG